MSTSTTEEDNNDNDISTTCANCSKEGSDVDNINISDISNKTVNGWSASVDLRLLNIKDDKAAAGNICANCDKGEECIDSLKTCSKCNMAKYCNRECQLAHWPQHKKDCKKRAAELHDEKLFKQPPSEDCPICMQTLPSLQSGSRFKLCCGKMICSGCIHANKEMQLKKMKHLDLCPFCRAPTPQGVKNTFEATKKQADAGHAAAINAMGGYYQRGEHGLPQDNDKALELYRQAAELGDATSHYNIGKAYMLGEGVEISMKRATHYWELAAIRGIREARHNLGVNEMRAGNRNRAIKHFMIAARGGSHFSLLHILSMYRRGGATQEEYVKALQMYKEYLNEIKSDQRDEAAAFSDEFKYYEVPNDIKNILGVVNIGEEPRPMRDISIFSLLQPQP